jgi:hypothetical protein
MSETYQDLEGYQEDPMSYLQDWIFHFNSITDQWAAIPRDAYTDYWNDYKNAGVLRSKNLNTLLELLHKSKGSTSLIDDIINGEVE